MFHNVGVFCIQMHQESVFFLIGSISGPVDRVLAQDQKVCGSIPSAGHV